MAASTPQQKRCDRAVWRLNTSLRILNIAKDACSIPTAQVAFNSVIDFLTVIRDTMANKHKYVYLGSTCFIVCIALERGLNERGSDELGAPVLVAIDQLIVTVTGMRKKIDKQCQRNAVSRFYHRISGKDEFAVCEQELQVILRIFNTQLPINNDVPLLSIHSDIQADQGSTDYQRRSTEEVQVLADEIQSITPSEKSVELE